MDVSDYYIKELKERVQSLSDALASGTVRNYEEYRYTCGQIRGLEAACFIISDLKRQLEHSDDE